MNPCDETSGFLFSHRCGRPGLLSCSACGKRICQQHARPRLPEGFQCVTCAHAGGGNDAGDSGDSEDDDDPFFYSARYRTRAGTRDNGPMDFTEGDQGVLDDRGDAFEDDMGGS